MIEIWEGVNATGKPDKSTAWINFLQSQIAKIVK